MQPIIPYSKPLKRPLNYPEYQKDYFSDAHVQVFKATIKANNEMLYKKITNLFNFMLRDNAFDWCNNYMCDHPKCRFVDLEQALCKQYRIVQNDEQVYI